MQTATECPPGSILSLGSSLPLLFWEWFNSTVGRFVGSTALGVNLANEYNRNGTMLKYLKNGTNTYCKPNDQIHSQKILSKTVEPEVMLSLGRPPSGDQPAVLICSAYNFFPKMIRVTWYRDGQEVTAGDVISSEERADGDWYYQMHSNLQLTPKAGEKISCVVEHGSLRETKELVWEEVTMPEYEWKEIAGGAGLGLGFILAAAGYIYYRIRRGNQEESTPLLGHR
ncbi:rano class II histocompatibility antigen, D-1 beta chain-like isoform X2 [Sardina pilchardus]|uniref:rano class II histocompatibility antigen, D-1 beta chain-like isoform X2 n=1 Tax=Sardina pilchardus TaxID=27697 RepID=UPI002E14B50A